MNLKFNKKNYKSNLVEFSEDVKRLKIVFFLFIFFLFIILYNVKNKIFMPLKVAGEIKIKFLS